MSLRTEAESSITRTCGWGIGSVSVETAEATAEMSLLGLVSVPQRPTSLRGRSTHTQEA